MTPSRRVAQKRQSEAIKVTQSFLGFVWLLAIGVSIFSGGGAAPFWIAAVLSIVPVVGLVYYRYRQRRAGESARARHHQFSDSSGS